MEIDRNGLEVLDRDECLRLLSSATLGRVGLTTGALPTVLPVDFLLDGDQILVRTSKGSEPQAATDNAVVAFETDDFDPLSHSGWSAVVTGVAREVTDLDELHALRSARLARWAPQGNGRAVAISTEMVPGQRIPVPAVRGGVR